MRLVTVILVLLLCSVQGALWLGKSGVPEVMERRSLLARLSAANDQARQRNAQLTAEVSDLKEGLEMVEEKARGELGMIRPDELMVVVTRSR